MIKTSPWCSCTAPANCTPPLPKEPFLLQEERYAHKRALCTLKRAPRTLKRALNTLQTLGDTPNPLNTLQTLTSALIYTTLKHSTPSFCAPPPPPPPLALISEESRRVAITARGGEGGRGGGGVFDSAAWVARYGSFPCSTFVFQH